MLTVYGIRNCDRCRDALKWLDEEGIPHTFLDLRQGCLEQEKIADWIMYFGWEKLLNRRGTTWRNLLDAEKNNLNSENVGNLMLAFPALITRPLFELEGHIILGFKQDQKDQLIHLSARLHDN